VTLATGPTDSITLSKLSPSGTRVVYAADRLYSVPVSGGSPIDLSGPLGGGQVTAFAITPDSTRVVYRADQDTPGTPELYSVPELGGPRTKLNAPLVAGGSVSPKFALSSDGRFVIYRADQDVDEQHEIYAVRVTGGPPTRLNGTLPAGGDTQEDISVTAEGRVLYRADQEIDGVVELFSVAPDTDGDAVADFVDNCPYAANADQEVAVLGQDLRALDRSTFGWPMPSEIVYLRGPLAPFHGPFPEYWVDVIEAQPAAVTSIEDLATPSVDEGWYYLVRPNCAAGSWQSSAGAEPDRDAALP
jgi:hypothetical protein